MSIKSLTITHVASLTSMNKYYLDGVLVVEGKSDVSYLSSFIKTLYFTTNGYDINDEKIDFLSRVSKVNKVIIFTDNDQAGLEISERIKSKINVVIVIKSRKITRKPYIKSGVAETAKEEIISSLKDHLVPYYNQLFAPSYNLNVIISCSIKPQEMKSKIIKEYRLIAGNIKYLENQLAMLKISPEEIKQKYGNK